MSVEQTTQLLQITCNSLLLALVSSLILAVLLLRQTVLEQMGTILGTIAPTEDSRRILMRKRQLQQNQRCLLFFSYAFGAALMSGFCMALRMLINWQWLIPVSLGVFVLAMAMLLGSVGVLAGGLMGLLSGEGRRKRTVEPTVGLEKTLGRQLF